MPRYDHDVQIPPQAMEAEQAVIGSCLIERDAIAQVEPLLRPEDFYRQSHASIYRGVLDLYRQQHPVDLITLGEYLRDRDELDSAGGTLYLTTVMTQVPTAAGAKRYAQIVKDCAIRRQLIRDADAIMASAYAMDRPLPEVMREAEGKLFTIANAQTQERTTRKSLGDFGYEFYRELHEASQNQRPSGLRTGWRSVNTILRPFRAGQLIIIAADTKTGKTAWALNLAIDMAEAGHHGIFFSMEMEGEALATRAILERTRYTQNDFDNIHAHAEPDEVGANVYEAVQHLYTVPLEIDEHPKTLEQMERALQLRISEDGPQDFLVVDYLQFIPVEGSAQKRYEEIGKISGKLKAIAQRYHLTVFALCQISTKGVAQRPTHRPEMSDLYESGRPGQDADLILGLYRPGHYGKREMERAGFPDTDFHQWCVEVFIIASRHGSAHPTRQSTWQLFQAEHVTFCDLTREQWRTLCNTEEISGEEDV